MTALLSHLYYQHDQNEQHSNMQFHQVINLKYILPRLFHNRQNYLHMKYECDNGLHIVGLLRIVLSFDLGHPQARKFAPLHHLKVLTFVVLLIKLSSCLEVVATAEWSLESAWFTSQALSPIHKMAATPKCFIKRPDHFKDIYIIHIQQQCYSSTLLFRNDIIAATNTFSPETVHFSRCCFHWFKPFTYFNHFSFVNL